MQSGTTAVQLKIWRLLVGIAVVAALYFLQEVILPVATAALLTFVFAPLVSRLEKWLGRTVAVLLTTVVAFAVIGVAVWISSVQIYNLAAQLPTYRANLRAKVQALNSSGDGPLGSAALMLQEIGEEATAPTPEGATPEGALPEGKTSEGTMPQGTTPEARPAEAKTAVTNSAVAGSATPVVPLPVQVIEHPQPGPARMWAFASTMLGPIGTVGVVVILTIFMSFKRDDLRDRIIGLIGKGRIGETTNAMRDASKRVNQFLRMNLLVNLMYGIPVAVGLYFIGVPGFLLWGFLAVILRFIPYLGPLIAMAFPMALSLAVFDNWTGPLMTLGLFLFLELVINNIVEPWLYGSSTGISSFALIVAALFWTWLWGTVGLVLSTPLTVCLLVIGKKVPQLSFFGTLLSEEGALAPHEMCYHRLLAGDRHALNRMMDEQCKTVTLDSMHGAILLPALGMVEDDLQRRTIDTGQHHNIIESLREVVDQLEFRFEHNAATEATGAESIAPGITLRIVCLPAESLGDEIAANMLAQVGRLHGFEAESLSSKLPVSEVRVLMEEKQPDWVWICAVNPRSFSRCRTLCAELRKQIRDLRISVAVWQGQEITPAALTGLKRSGAESVTTTFGETLLRMEALRSSFESTFLTAPMPDNEAERLNALVELGLLNQGRDELFDRTTAELTRIFEVPIALVSLVDSGWQHFASQCGLPSDLAMEGKTTRDVSVCGHVVAANQPLVIEDLARDRRFAGNPLLRERNLRFYAGVPLRTSAGLPLGSLCILDTRPRTISEREIRLMQMIAEGLMVEVEARTASPKAALEAVAVTV